MPVPSTINDLSTVANDNYPKGNENPFPLNDDHIRAHASFIAALRDGKLDASLVSAYMLTVLNDADAATARATLGALGTVIATPSAGTDAANKSYVDTAVAGVRLPGEIQAMARLTAPPGWLLIDGKTIGSASSGATSRANADTFALFEQVWAFPATSVPIYTSTGAASTRGASAAADFAANKRLPLFTPDGGAFLRMWTPTQTRDAGREAGSVQEDAFESHTHSQRGLLGASGQFAPGGGGGIFLGNGFDYEQTAATGGTETRPYNLSMPHYIKL